MAGFVGIGTFEKKIGTSKSETELKQDKATARKESIKEAYSNVDKVRKGGKSIVEKITYASESTLGRKVFKGSVPKSVLKKRFF